MRRSRSPTRRCSRAPRRGRCTFTPPRAASIAARSTRLAATRGARRGRCSPTASTSTTRSSPAVRASGATLAHNARSNMNNAVGRARVARPRSARRARHGRDRLGHVRGVPQPRSSASTRTTCRRRPDWPLATARGGRPPCGPDLRRVAARARCSRAHPPTSSSSTTSRPTPLDGTSFAGHWIFGLSSRSVRDVMVAGELGRPRPAPRPRRPGRARRRGAAGRRTPLGAARRDPAHPFEPQGAITMDRVALYLQDKHPIRDGMRYAQLAEARGFEAVWQAESRLVREATVPMAAFAAVTERIARRLRRRQQLDAQRRPARGDLLDPRRPRARPGQARHRRVVGPARVEGRHPTARKPLKAMRETVEAVRRLLAMERVTYTASSSTSTTSRSTSSTATARRSTCRSTSARPR